MLRTVGWRNPDAYRYFRQVDRKFADAEQLAKPGNRRLPVTSGYPDRAPASSTDSPTHRKKKCVEIIRRPFGLA